MTQPTYDRRRRLQDQVCGDRICLAPDEFPAYGRFGCDADCGSLLGTAPPGSVPALQVSLYYDFSHSQASAQRLLRPGVPRPRAVELPDFTPAPTDGSLL